MIPNAETMAWEAGPEAVLAAFDNALKENKTSEPHIKCMPDSHRLRIWLGYYERWCL